MRAVAPLLIVLAVAALVAYLTLAGPGYAPVRYVPHTSPTSAVVSGRAVDGAGRPVVDVPLTWFSAVEADGGPFGGTMFRGEDTGVRTAADGTFRIEGLRGEVGYVAVGSVDAVREGQSGRVRLRPGFDASELELNVVEVPYARRLQGTVLFADGSPAVSVLIQVNGETWRGDWQQVAVTDASGVFEVVAPWGGGACQLVLRRTDGSEQPLGTVPLGTRGHTLRLPW